MEIFVEKPTELNKAHYFEREANKYFVKGNFVDGLKYLEDACDQLQKASDKNRDPFNRSVFASQISDHRRRMTLYLGMHNAILRHTSQISRLDRPTATGEKPELMSLDSIDTGVDDNDEVGELSSHTLYRKADSDSDYCTDSLMISICKKPQLPFTRGPVIGRRIDKADSSQLEELEGQIKEMKNQIKGMVDVVERQNNEIVRINDETKRYNHEINILSSSTSLCPSPPIFSLVNEQNTEDDSH